MIKSLIVLAFFLILGQATLAGPVSHDAALRALQPARGHLLHGVFPGGYTGEEDDISPSQVRDYEKTVGRRVAWVMFSHNWFQGHAFPRHTADWIKGQGATPYVRLMMRSDTNLSHREPVYTLAAIANGDFDADLRAWGIAVAHYGSPIIAEFGTEMNGEWFQWNARWNGRARGAALFQDAYRRIIDITRAAGASNIVWVFHANNADNPNRHWNQLESYYPGDDYIDWLGVSIYSALDPYEDSYTVDFTEDLTRIMARFTQMAPSKPVIVAEFGTDVRNPNEPAAPWANRALTTILSGQYPNLIGFNWWNETWPNGDNPARATDLRVQSNADLTAVMRAHLANPRVQPRP